MDGKTNTRAHPRVAIHLPVRLADDIGSFEKCFTRDLSVGGAFILAPRPRPIGHRFEAYLYLPHGASEIATHGEVRWQCGEGWGIRFVIVEPRQQHQLRQFVGSLLAAEGSGDRKHVCVKVQMLVNLKLEEVFLRSLVENISQGGAYLKIERNLQVGDELEILLVHPALGRAINLDGQVVRAERVQDAVLNQKTCGVAVRFVNLNQAQARELQALLRRLLR